MAQMIRNSKLSHFLAKKSSGSSFILSATTSTVFVFVCLLQDSPKLNKKSIYIRKQLLQSYRRNQGKGAVERSLLGESIE